ncbi:MAG TPA: histidine kinase N-terminal 7TM domain-containing protein [Vicinamibacterales bacterium]|nr:histidine kinase N-terminal 7TM domain-containing protein [Vicinamibacterales bacterium]
MTWTPTIHAVVLLASAGLAAWAAIVARGRRTVPGSAVFGWLMFATAYWAIIGALHAVVEPVASRIVLAQFQYLGIAAVAPLWLLFASQYARARWLDDTLTRSLLWVIPGVTVLIAFTNAWHHLLWTDIRLATPSLASRLVYSHGPWFWIALIFNYCALAAGTVLLFQSVRRFPLPYRRQTTLIIAGALLPWVGNVLYIAKLMPAGLDLTPVAFAASGTSLLWGFYRHRLLGLVPIARDLVIDSMDEAVIVLDSNRHIIDFNPAAGKVAGCTVDSIGRSIADAVPWWTRASADGQGSPGYPAVIASGGRFLEFEVKPVRDGQERFAGWLVVARDISARRKAEIERRDLERRMLEQQKAESLAVLAGGVAHDFNNLLTGILGNADLLSMAANDNPALRKSADAIVIGAQRAAGLVSQMLAYAGQGRVISELIDLDELVREMLDLLQASVARHCTLSYSEPGALPRVKVDPTQVRQVVLNLIVNASDAVDDGGRVTVSGGTEFLDAAALAGLIFSSDAVPGHFSYVQVADDGPGMDRATVARIFDPFYSTKQSGRGLGLAAVQGIVRSHRGALRVDTAPGRGTTFKVWFPIDVPDAAALRA